MKPGNDTMPPLATIVVTTRDRPQLADRAVASAISQTLETVEVIVVDDGSAVPYAPSHSDSRVRLLRHDEPKGPCAARNTGLKAARAEWITFLDDDDFLLPQMVEVSLRAAAASPMPPPVSVLSGMEVVDETGRVLETRRPPTLERGSRYFFENIEPDESFQTHNTLMAPVAVVEGIGGWNESIPASEHDDFFLRLNESSSIQGVAEVTYRLTAHPGSRLSKEVLARAQGMELTLRLHAGAFRSNRRKHARYRSAMGATYLRAGQWMPAVKASTRALWLDPTRAQSYKWWLAALAGPRALSLVRQTRVGARRR